MTRRHGAHRRGARRSASLAAVALAAVGAGALTVGIVDQEPPPPGPAVSGHGKDTSATRSPAEPAEPGSPGRAEHPEHGVRELDYSVPTRVMIPAIGVNSALVDIGLDPTGAMETPEPVDKAGWFTPSPPPGIPGATVLAGHVTWNQEPSVFYRLGDLRRGDRIRVRREDGIVTVFRVTRIGSFPKESFPTDAVYSQPERSELRLITCGGEYDEQGHRYLANVIVWARITKIASA